jgi:hypothetical protein
MTFIPSVGQKWSAFGDISDSTLTSFGRSLFVLYRNSKWQVNRISEQRPSVMDGVQQLMLFPDMAARGLPLGKEHSCPVSVLT